MHTDTHARARAFFERGQENEIVHSVETPVERLCFIQQDLHWQGPNQAGQAGQSRGMIMRSMLRANTYQQPVVGNCLVQMAVACDNDLSEGQQSSDDCYYSAGSSPLTCKACRVGAFVCRHHTV